MSDKLVEGKIQKILNDDDDMCLLGDEKVKVDVDVIPTGSYFLDARLGIGGWPMGRWTEVWGNEGTGKTTLAIHACIEAQIKYPDKFVAYIDVEHAFDPKYAKNIGLDLNKTIFSQPDSGEKAINNIKKLAESNTCSIIVIDSIAGLTPEAELEGKAEDSTMASLARLVSKFWRQVKGAARTSNTAIFCINQIRTTSMGMFSSTGPTGGKALKYATTIRVQLKLGNKGKPITQDNVAVAIIVDAKITKNKLASPHREASFYIEFGKGMSKTRDIYELALHADIIQKSGTWHSYNKENIGQGATNVLAKLENDTKFYNEIKKKVDTYYKEYPIQ